MFGYHIVKEVPLEATAAYNLGYLAAVIKREIAAMERGRTPTVALARIEAAAQEAKTRFLSYAS